MAKLTPGTESVFRGEYWDPIRGDASMYKHKKLSREVHNQLDGLCAQAATAIFAGEPRKKLPEDTQLDLSPDNLNTSPGTILLTDVEMLAQVKNHNGKECVDSLPYYESRIMEHEDLMALPSTLFRKNSRPVRQPKNDFEHQIYVYPFEKILCDPDLDMHYARIVNLVSFAPDIEGETAAIGKISWATSSFDQVKRLAGVF